MMIRSKKPWIDNSKYVPKSLILQEQVDKSVGLGVMLAWEPAGEKSVSLPIEFGLLYKSKRGGWVHRPQWRTLPV